MPSRRHFLQSAACAAAAMPCVPLLGADGATRKFRTALIGSGWWGMNILREALAHGRVKLAALCDVDQNRLEHAAEECSTLTSDTPKKFKDYRELLAQEKPEIVIIATPDHWHALPAIAAARAGAHIYLEKPTAHTVAESRALVKAAAASGVTVQVGLHRRIGPHHVSAMNFLKSGKAGPVGMVRLFVHGGGRKESPKPNSSAPDGMDWDFYCGPAPLRPFNTKIHPGGWRMFMDFANGLIGDWGVHWLDQVTWWTDGKMPRRVFSSGGRPISGPAVLTEKEQTTDAPEAQTAVFDYEDFTVTWEHRRFAENGAEKHKIGAYFYGVEGTLHIGWRDGWTFYPADSKSPVVHEDHKLQEPDGHNIALLWADFIDAIDKKRPATSNLPAAHLSSTLPMLANISLKLGRSLEWDPARQTIANDAEAAKLLTKTSRAPWRSPEG